jgi:predicted ribosome quality control (RQC) complex YloA/Tae2 family protein
MALDGILLNKIVSGMQGIIPARIQKIYEISNTEVLLQVHCALGRKQLLISCHSVYNRMLLTERSYPTPDTPDNFIMVLRKYLEGGTIISIEQAGLDRWCTLTIRRHNNIGDLENIRLVVELMGKYANVILVTKENKIIDAMKRIPPFENSRRMILPQAEFVPMPEQDKKDPFTCHTVDPEVPLVKQFAGFSPLLARETEYRMSHGESFAQIMEEVRNSTSLYIYEDSKEPLFHCIELKHKGTCRCYPLFEGFDMLYYHREEKERIKQITGDIYHFVKRELKHQQIKLPRLLKEYDNALDCDRWKKYGDLLFTWSVQNTKGQKEIELEDYETGKMITVPLDEKLDGPGNARKCYTKYNKLKKGQVYLKEQIELSENEIAYFEGLLEQLDQADFETAGEIKEELIRLGYLKSRQSSRKKKKKKEEKPHVTTITAPSGISISYGRNNLQNDTLTWHMARKNEIWMHAKDYHGSHVVIHADEADEQTMRLAAMIAAWFSQGRHSSSVPVIYCPVKNLKKIPGAKPGMVQLGSYKMIYIDPDEEKLAKAGVRI